MPSMYEKPVRELMWDMTREMKLSKDQVISRDDVIDWFQEKYPRIKEGTITAHLIRLSTNARSRHHYGAKPGQDDLLYQIDGSRFRLFDAASDPTPLYDPPTEVDESDPVPTPVGDDDNTREFAYEKDLQNFLSKNLELLEPGLRLYEEEGIHGVEFPAGGRFVDILAVDVSGNLVVVELKVSRGYDRVVGQVMRYVGWIRKYHAEPGQTVRGFIVAREISDDLRLACSGVSDVSLFEYEMAVRIKPVET